MPSPSLSTTRPRRAARPAPRGAVILSTAIAFGCARSPEPNPVNGGSASLQVDRSKGGPAFVHLDRDGEPVRGLVGVVAGARDLAPPRDGIPDAVIQRDDAPRPTPEERAVPPGVAVIDPSHQFTELDLLRALPSGDDVRIVVQVADPTFDWRALGRSGAGSSRHSDLIGVRRRQVREATASLVERLASAGARSIQVGDLSAVVAATVPARRAVEVASWPNVVLVERDARGVRNSQYGGNDAREGMRTSTFQNHSIYGNGPGRSGGRTRFGVVDLENGITSTNDWPLWNHRGYERTVSLFPLTIVSRWVGVRDCVSVPCNLFPMGAGTWPTGNWDSHANNVARVLAGSIENGLSASSFTLVEQRQRSGIATEGDLFYYRVDGNSFSLSAAIDRLIVDGIDVANMSIGVPCDPSPGCSLACDAGTANLSLQNAASAGVLLVASIGNNRTHLNSSSCSADYPATNRNVLAVGALETTTGTAYDTSPVASYSSAGGMLVLVDGSGNRPFAVADLAAPGSWVYTYGPAVSDYSLMGSRPFVGTSFAAPAVAGTAGLLREAFNNIGWNLNDARSLMVNMLLFGDGYQGTTNGEASVGMDRFTGAGRVHAHVPATDDMVAPWGWGFHVFRLGPGQVASFPVWDELAEDPAVQHWKCAMTWLEPARSGAGSTSPVADLVLEVWDTCAPGGAQMVQTDFSFDIRKRIELNHSQIMDGSRARCLEGRVRAWAVPSDSPNPLAPPAEARTREVYVADYFHSGDRANH